MGAGELDADPRAAKALDRLAVERVSDVALAHERPAARLEPERPVGPARTRQRGQALDGLSCALGITAARGGQDELGEGPVREPEVLRMLGGVLRGLECLRIAPESVE